MQDELGFHANGFAFFESTCRTLSPPVKIHFAGSVKLANENLVWVGDDASVKALASLAAQHVVMVARCAVAANDALVSLPV